VLIGVPTPDAEAYDFQNKDGKSVALVAGLANSTLSQMLSEKNTDGSNANRFDTHIIRKDGDYVLHPNNDNNENHSQYDNYFEQIRGGFGMDAEEAESLIQTLETKMSTDKIFSAVVNTSTPRKHIYCAKLENSDWYLVTVMNYTDLDEKVTGLTKSLTGFTIGICAVIMVILIAVFVIYLILNKRNLQQVEHARELAEEANRAKSDFLSNMSHDIRTPMNAIVGMTAIATANINDTEQVSNCLKKISLSSRHLLGLINDVLDMSKIESGKMTLNMEELSLSEVVESISTIIQPQIKIKKQHFDIYVHDIFAEKVYCDSVRLNQVLLNLLSNAYKFTPENGKIELSLYQEKSPLGEKLARTHIIVQDNGIGMSKEFQKKIFDSFTREDSSRVNKTEGTGLGMSITKYIIDSMHGTIEVDSKQGEGTTFHVVIDLEIADTEEIDMILPEWKMLVVDDDQMLCDTTVAALASIGVKADSTLNGESAIQKAVEAHDAGMKYDIILMDWKLPGIDGLETARRLHKKLGDNIPILLISAYDWSEIEDEARAAGISGFISKPLFKSTLFYGLRKFTESEKIKPVQEEQVKREVDLKGKRLLVAEDNDLNWEIAEVLLTGEGFILEHAENGQTCVDMLLAHKPGYYDAILMDVRMPVMSGLEATTVIRGLRKNYNKVPIIAMTADAFAEDMHKCLECGMNAHIAKPIDIDVVKATLAKFIN
ncbi:MAG: response regulator, partial [Clostridia bacterium]|nr:response regulator [Clostridia bacterium]